MGQLTAEQEQWLETPAGQAAFKISMASVLKDDPRDEGGMNVQAARDLALELRQGDTGIPFEASDPFEEPQDKVADRETLDYFKSISPEYFNKYVRPKASQEEIAELRKRFPHLFIGDGAVLGDGSQPAPKNPNSPVRFSMGTDPRGRPQHMEFGKKGGVIKNSGWAENPQGTSRLNMGKMYAPIGGAFGGLLRGAKNLFEDPTRMALLSGGLSAMDPNSYYDKQGFYSPWTGLQAGLGTGIRTYKKLGEPRKLGFEEQERIRAKYAPKTYGHIKPTGDGQFVDIRGLEGSESGQIFGRRKPVDLDNFETFVYNKLRVRPEFKSITPRHIKENKVAIPDELFKEYAEMRKVFVQPEQTYNKEYFKGLAGSDVKLVEATDENAESASGMDADLDNQWKLLHSPSAEEVFGPYSSFKYEWRRVTDALGLPTNTDKTTSYEMFAKSTMEMLLQQLKQQKGPQTEGDAKRALRTLPGPENTILSSKYIIAMKRAINARAIAKQQFMHKYIDDSEDGTARGLARAWGSKKNKVSSKSIFEWIAGLGDDYTALLIELSEKGILPQDEIDAILLGME